MANTDLKPCPFCGGNVGTMMLMDSIVYESNAVEMVVETWNRRVENG